MAQPHLKLYRRKGALVAEYYVGLGKATRLAKRLVFADENGPLVKADMRKGLDDLRTVRGNPQESTDDNSR